MVSRRLRQAATSKAGWGIPVAPVLITSPWSRSRRGSAGPCGKAYVGSPWTRDGTVRAYVVTMAPEVAGRIVKLPVADNQFVHKGDVLLRSSRPIIASRSAAQGADAA